jgi:hypothetical protein
MSANLARVKPFLHTASIRMFPTWQSAWNPMAIYNVNDNHTSLRPSSFIKKVGIEAGHLSDMRIPTSYLKQGDNSPGPLLFSPIFAPPHPLQSIRKTAPNNPTTGSPIGLKSIPSVLFCERRSLGKLIPVSSLVDHSRILQHRNEDAVINKHRQSRSDFGCGVRLFGAVCAFGSCVQEL